MKLEIIKMWDHRDPDAAAKMKRRGGVADILGVACHTTGFGKGVQVRDKKYSSDEDVDRSYAKHMDNNLKYKCDYLVGRTGLIFEMIPETHYGYHTGSGKLLQLKQKTPPGWWSARFPGVDRPTDLLLWSRGSVNRNSRGIDLLAPRGGGHNFPQAQLDATAELIAWMTCRYSIYIQPQTVTDHSSLDWISRTNKHGPWDLPDGIMPKLRESAKGRALAYGMDYSKQVST